MTLKSLQFMALSARNISSLADRVYIHPDISPYFYGSGEYMPSWYHGEETTSDDLANYLFLENDREKIAVLLHYLHNSLMRINYEKAFIKCWQWGSKGKISLAELTRLGVKPDIDYFYANTYNLPLYDPPDAMEIYTNTDTNLERKTRDPRLTLIRTKNILALSQACYFLGVPSKETRSFEELLDMAISRSNFKAFEYLIHSNIEFDLDDLVFKIIDSGEENYKFLKELCRRGHKIAKCTKNGKTAIEYAVGIIPDENFNLFFYKAGRLVYEDPSDAVIMDRVKDMMENNEIVMDAINLKKYKSFPVKELMHDIPRNEHKKTRVKIKKNQPLFSNEIKIHDYEGDENIDPSDTNLVVCFGSVKKYYTKLSTDMVKVSRFLEKTIGEDINGDALIIDLENMVTDPEELTIVLSFMKCIGEHYDKMTDDIPPIWMENLFKLNLPTLMGVYDIASYLDVKSMYKPLSFYIDREAEKYTTEELRFIASMMVSDMDFETITFRNVIKCNGFGYGEI